MVEADVKARSRFRVPVIWLVPIIAAVLGLWLVIYTYMTEGPEITIALNTAAGIEPGKTKIKALNVELGIVESLELTQDMKGVIVKAKLERFAVPLLRDDTQFWVVRPRVGPGGISGLGTLLSGSYIRLAAGTGNAGRREFVGLDNPPATPAGTPGLIVYLSSNRAGSVSAGDPVLYRGYRVGQVDSADFDAQAQRISYEIFIDKPYDTLISENTRFWNASGIALEASADGIKLEFGSLQTLLVGGVAFDLPEGELPGTPAQDGDQFELFPNQASIEQKVYQAYVEYVVSFPQSLRGLSPGAPVEYRGVQVGTVQRLLIGRSKLHCEHERDDSPRPRARISRYLAGRQSTDRQCARRH
jgi:paraquat-inducible protein B